MTYPSPKSQQQLTGTGDECHTPHRQATMTTTIDDKVEKSALFRLPGEIRNRIYRYVAVREEPVELRGCYGYYSLHSVPRPPSLMSVCSTLFAEVKPIYYEENTFHFKNDAVGRDGQRIFRKRAGSSADKVISIAVSRYFGGHCYPHSMQFSVNKQRTVTLTVKVRGGNKMWCCCALQKAAEKRERSLIDFLEAYMMFERNFNDLEGKCYQWRPRVCDTCGSRGISGEF